MPRRVADPNQDDLFGERVAERETAAEAAWLRYLDELDCCTGLPVPPDVAGNGQKRKRLRCGRCGAVHGAYDQSHDMGWSGCYLPDENGRVNFAAHLTREQLSERHDAAHRPPCSCGDAWGVHRAIGGGRSVMCGGREPATPGAAARATNRRRADMGDRTSYTIIVQGTDVAEDNYLDRALADEYGAEVEGGGCWAIPEHSVGCLDELAETLNRLQLELDNAFAFRIWEDPKYEWDGEWSGWIPGLGTAAGLADGDGTPHVPNREIVLAIECWEEQAGGDAQNLVQRLHALVHHEWERAWAALDATLPEPDPEPV